MANKDFEYKILSDNRQAGHNYFLMDRFEAGLALTGTEVKAARSGQVQLKDSYAAVENGEAAEYLRVAVEARLPEAVGDDDGVAFAGGDGAAGGDGRAGDVEEVVADGGGEDAQAFVAVAPVHFGHGVHAGEAVKDLRVAQEAVDAHRLLVAEHGGVEEGFGVADGGLAEEELRGEAEDGGVGADAEGEGEDGGEGEAAVAGEGA